MEAEGGDRAAAGKRRGRAPARQLQPRTSRLPLLLSAAPVPPVPSRRSAPLLAAAPLASPPSCSCTLLTRAAWARCSQTAPVPLCPALPAASRRCGTAGSPSSPQRPPWRCEEAAKTRPKSRAFQENFVPSPGVMAGRAPALRDHAPSAQLCRGSLR